MTKRVSVDMVEAGWADVVGWLPPDLDALAASSGGFQRRRAVRSAADLVRVALAYAIAELSLRSVAAWMASHGLGKLSDVAVLGRLRRGWPFLAEVARAMLARQLWDPPRGESSRRVRVLDATTLSAPGAQGADWRLHATYDLAQGVVRGIDVTDGRGGEHLGRAVAEPGDVVVADRGYAHPSRILDALERGLHVVQRIGHSVVPLVDADGEALQPVRFARRRRPRAGRPRSVESIPVYLRDDAGKEHPLRLVVVRKAAEATHRERKRLRRDASRRGKQPTATTIDAAAFTFLLTSLPASEADDVAIAELYRVRWQIEICFKRWKSILDLDHLRADDPDLARAYVYAKLIAAALADTVARASRAFSPWGVPLSRLDLEDVDLGGTRAPRRGDRVRTAPRTHAG